MIILNLEPNNENDFKDLIWLKNPLIYCLHEQSKYRNCAFKDFCIRIDHSRLQLVWNKNEVQLKKIWNLSMHVLPTPTWLKLPKKMNSANIKCSAYLMQKISFVANYLIYMAAMTVWITISIISFQILSVGSKWE